MSVAKASTIRAPGAGASPRNGERPLSKRECSSGGRSPSMTELGEPMEEPEIIIIPREIPVPEKEPIEVPQEPLVPV